jgi:serine phosphatase RsbU (regulator of sigma subunit)
VGTASVEEIRDRILNEVRGFMSAQHDDLTLVVVRYDGQPAGARP